jgi:hypothetical protein
MLTLGMLLETEMSNKVRTEEPGVRGAVPTTHSPDEEVRRRTIRDRCALQGLLRDNLGAIAPEMYVLAEEYGIR